MKLYFPIDFAISALCSVPPVFIQCCWAFQFYKLFMVIKFHLMENNTIVLRKPYPTRKKKRGNISQKRGSKAFNGTFVNQFWQHLQKKPFFTCRLFQFCLWSLQVQANKISDETLFFEKLWHILVPVHAILYILYLAGKKEMKEENKEDMRWIRYAKCKCILFSARLFYLCR